MQLRSTMLNRVMWGKLEICSASYIETPNCSLYAGYYIPSCIPGSRNRAALVIAFDEVTRASQHKRPRMLVKLHQTVMHGIITSLIEKQVDIAFIVNVAR